MLIKVNKRTWFLIGIVIGLTLGIIVGKSYLHFFFENKNDLKENILPNKEEKEKAKLNEVVDEVKERKNSNIKTDTSEKDKDTYDTLSRKSDSLDLDSLNNNLDTVLAVDSLDSNFTDTIWSWEDTITIDTIEEYQINLNTEKKTGSSLMKHELLEVRYITPSGEPADFECMKSNELDSALIDHDVDINNTTIRVEFWASPINYRAYLLTKNKLLLFGIERSGGVKLKYLDSGELQMEYQNMNYILKCSDNLKPSILK